MALPAHLITSSPDDLRQSKRHALRLETSLIQPDGVQANVTVHNISAAGLLIETDLPIASGDQLAVDLPEAGSVAGQIVWQSGHLFGCAFEQALGEAALAAAQLRGHAPASPPVQPASAMPSVAPLAYGETLGRRINKLRREASLTLADVAAALGVSKPTVWAWEKDKARPLPERIGALAAVLQVDEIELAAPFGKGATRASSGRNSAALVEDCRARIASEFGIAPDKVRIMIDL